MLERAHEQRVHRRRRAITLAADATSYADTGRGAGTTYWYRVQAINATDSSAWSSVGERDDAGRRADAARRADGPGRDGAVDDAGQPDVGRQRDERDGLRRSSAARQRRSPSPTAIALAGGRDVVRRHRPHRVDARTGTASGRSNGTRASAWSNAASATTHAAPPPTAPAAPTGLTATRPRRPGSTSRGPTTRRTRPATSSSAHDERVHRADAITLAAGATSYADTGCTATTSTGTASAR